MLTICAAGRLGGDAEMRYTAGGTAVCGFSIAVDRGYGESKHACWIRCSLFGQRAQPLQPYLTKGTSVTVSGQGDLREWQAQDGTTRTSLELRVDEVTLQGGGQDGNQKPAQAQQRASAPQNQDGFDDDPDLPF